jgi:hypothetical protein
LRQAREMLDQKIRKWGPDCHCNQIIVSEESRANAIKNEPDAEGKRRTRIGLETYSPEAYSAWNATLEYLIERCAFNPILVVDLLLLLVQSAHNSLPLGRDGDGIDVALQGLFAVNGDYEQRLRDAKSAYRARRKKA